MANAIKVTYMNPKRHNMIAKVVLKNIKRTKK